MAHLFPQSWLLCPPSPSLLSSVYRLQVFLTGCPPPLVNRLACYRTKLRVCHAFCNPLQNSLHFIYATFVRKLPSSATFRLVNFLQHTNRALHSTGKPNELQSTVSFPSPPKNHAKPLCFQHRSFPFVNSFFISHLVLTRKRRRTHNSIQQIHFITLLHSIPNPQPCSTSACSRLFTPFFYFGFFREKFEFIIFSLLFRITIFADLFLGHWILPKMEFHSNSLFQLFRNHHILDKLIH